MKLRTILQSLVFVIASSIALAGSSTITVFDTTGATKTFNVTTDSSGHFVSQYVMCDQSAAANCQGVDSNHNAAVAIPTAGAAVDGWNATEGTKADAAYTSGSGSIVAILKGIYTAVSSAIPLGTTGGITPLKLSGITNSALAIKNSGGQLFLLQCGNTNASEAYVQIFNIAAASVTLGTSTPTLSIPIAATSTGGFALSNVGLQFNTAMSAAVTTTATGSTALGSALDCNAGYN